MGALARPYEVFARSRRGDALRHIGGVHAPSDALARLYARWVYDEETWLDLAVVRREHLLPVSAVQGDASAPAAPPGERAPA
jgi:1,2-phenylacetyl-CoA epoxidase PaaB subunit